MFISVVSNPIEIPFLRALKMTVLYETVVCFNQPLWVLADGQITVTIHPGICLCSLYSLPKSGYSSISYLCNISLPETFPFATLFSLSKPNRNTHAPPRAGDGPLGTTVTSKFSICQQFVQLFLSLMRAELPAWSIALQKLFLVLTRAAAFLSGWI